MSEEYSIIQGRYVRLERLNSIKHLTDLYSNLKHPQLWHFFHSDQTTSLFNFSSYLTSLSQTTTIFNYSICENDTGQALGFLGFTPSGVDSPNALEIVNVMFSPKLQRTTKATEAFYLMARHCFEVVGCEVLEWRCDLGNWRSEQAARRFGYYCDGVKEDEGISYKEFFMIEPDWEVVKEEYERWLNPDNFDKHGNQLTKLEIWPSSI